MSATLHIVGNELWDEKLRLRLQQHLQENPHLNTSILGRADRTGVSRAALDSYLAKTYFKSELNPNGVIKSDVEEKIRRYLDKFEGTNADGEKREFVRTAAWHQFESGCNLAIHEKVMTVITGSPGLGKSECLKQYALKNTQTPPVVILCSPNITAGYFVKKICKLLSLNDNGTTPQLEDRICERLTDRPKAIIVDQANYLNERSLGTLCYVWEQTRTPIVLVGTKDLYEMFVKSRLTEDVRAQLLRRIDMFYFLDKLSDKEVKTIIYRELGESVSAETVSNVMTFAQNNFCYLDRLLRRIKRLQKANRQDLASGDLRLEDLAEQAQNGLRVA